MRIAIATDAWSPQVNGVVTTLTQTRNELVAQGHEVLMITPEGRRTVPCPSYPEIRLVLFGGRAITRELDAFKPDCIHIATEGPLGFSVRRYCIKRKLPFTTAYHTQFPEYVRARVPIPVRWTVALLRWFHRRARHVLVPSESIQAVLRSRGFDNVVLWSRGVDTDVFSCNAAIDYALKAPIWVYMGRVAVEKNIEAFLDLDLGGSKVVIGDGPDLDRLKLTYPGCLFVGYKFGHELAAHLAGADVFVFPSKTDTFGIVLLEAMACGLPVAAYPVTGPVDIVEPGVTGVLDDDLAAACHEALAINKEDCVKLAAGRSWQRCTEQFISHLAVRNA